MDNNALHVLTQSPFPWAASKLARQVDAMNRKCVRIKHAGSHSLIADGPVGWAITPFEGNFYIRKKNLLTDGFRIN